MLLKILKTSVFLFLLHTQLTVQLFAEESPTKLKLKKANWRLEKVATFADGTPEKIIYHAPCQGSKKDLPVKEMHYDIHGKLVQERDLAVINKKILYHGPSVSYDEKGRIKRISFYHEGILHGIMKDIYPTGMVKKTTSYENGILDGPSIVYFNNGQIAKKSSYKQGKLEGDLFTYYPNGFKESHLFYEKGVLQGLSSYWFDDGEIKSKKYYLYGLLNDTFSNKAVTTYRAPNVLEEVQCFTFGIPSGVHIMYHPNGKESYKVNYKDGLKVGMETFSSSNGSLIGEGQYANGKPVGFHYLKNDQAVLIYSAHYDIEGNLEEPIVTFYDDGEKKQQYKKTDLGYQGDYLEWYPNGTVKRCYHYANDAFDGPQEEFFDNGILKLKCFYADDKKTGSFKEWFENGNLAVEIEFIKGIKTGSFKTFYENGQLKNETTFDPAGNKTGDEKYFAENGQLIFKGFYSSGLKLGEHLSWYASGKLKSKIHYTNDLPDGDTQVFYENDKPEIVAHYINGLLDGTFSSWFEDGEIHELKQYAAGKPIGKHIENHPKDNNTLQLAKELHYVDGYLDGEQKRFHKNGKMELVLNYKNNVLHGTKSLWNDKGILLEEASYTNGDLDGRHFIVKEDGTEIITHYKDNLQNGLHEIYYPADSFFGKVKAFEATYEKGLIQGETSEYNEAGTKIVSTSYENGLKNGPAFFYQHNGVLKIATEFKDDKQHGVTSEYYPSGNLKTRILFIDDLKEGEEVGYFDSEKELVATSKNFKKGLLNGFWQEWNINKALLYQAEYKDDKKNGLLSKYTEDGTPYVYHRYADDILIEKIAL